MGTRVDVPDEAFSAHRIDVRHQIAEILGHALDATDTEQQEVARRVRKNKWHVTRIVSALSEESLNRGINIDHLANIARALGYSLELKLKKLRPESISS